MRDESVDDIERVGVGDRTRGAARALLSAATPREKRALDRRAQPRLHRIGRKTEPERDDYFEDRRKATELQYLGTDDAHADQSMPENRIADEGTEERECADVLLHV